MQGRLSPAVLVSGASSPLGARLIDILRRESAPIRVLARGGGAGTVDWGDKVELFQGDLTRPEGLQGVGEGVTMLFHLASFHPAADDPDPEGNPAHHRVTVEGTRHLLAQLDGVTRIVFASSVRAAETQAHAYGKAKREAERLLLDFSASRGIHAAIVRFPAFYGTPGLGGLSMMARAVRAGRFPPIPEFGNRRSFIHVADAARALLAARDAPGAAGRVLTASDGEAYSTRRIYLAMREAAGLSEPRWVFPPWLLRAMAGLGDTGGKLLHRRLPFNGEVLARLAESAWHDDGEMREITGYLPVHTIEAALKAGEI